MFNYKELYHWGILGQKWGVRKYQNEDGSLTEAGKKRYSTYKYTDNSNKSQMSDKEHVSKIYDQQMSSEKQIFGGAKDAANTISNILPSGNGKTTHKDYSNLTDEELRKRVNRLNLEEQYGKLTGDTKYVKSGSEYAREILQTVGAVAGIGVSAVAIMQGIKTFKGE